jgi:ketosteroid isomerase-like protein
MRSGRLITARSRAASSPPTRTHHPTGCALRLVALLEQSGRPHGSEGMVHLQYGRLHTIRDGKIRRIEVFATHDEALQAAGLAR